MAKMTIEQIREALAHGAHVKPDDTDAADIERLIYIENRLEARKNKRGEVVYVNKRRIDNRLNDLTYAERHEHFHAREREWKREWYKREGYEVAS